MPGTPALAASSTTPNNTGGFTVAWDAATDQDAGDTVTYTLQKRDRTTRTGRTWPPVSPRVPILSPARPRAPGATRCKGAVDNHDASSAFAPDDAPIVVVDQSAPMAPIASTPPAAYVDDNGGQWFKDSATDNASNVSDETALSGLVDATLPAVQATCPANVVLHANAAASWTASDEGSGLATAASGSVPLDTSTVGDHTVTVPAGTAVDNVGHVSDAAECHYQVGYAFGGFLQPINDTGHFVGQTTSVFKAGSTIPVKFQLFDANGVPIQASTPPSWLNPAKGSTLPSTVAVDETVYTATASSGSVFKWDATSQQYVYNYKTDKSQTGSYWRIGLTLDDGTTYVVSIALK